MKYLLWFLKGNDTDDLSNGWWKFNFAITGEHYIKIDNGLFKNVVIFHNITWVFFYKINAALLCVRDFQFICIK